MQKKGNLLWVFFLTLTKIYIFWQFWPELLNWRLMVKFWRIEISLFILIHPFTLSPFLTSYVRPSVTPAPWAPHRQIFGTCFYITQKWNFDFEAPKTSVFRSTAAWRVSRRTSEWLRWCRANRAGPHLLLLQGKGKCYESHIVFTGGSISTGVYILANRKDSPHPL